MGCQSTGDPKTDNPRCTSFDSCLQAANELRGMATDDRYSRSRGDASLEQSEVTATTVMGFASPDYPYYTARNERGGGKLAAFGRKIGAADLFAEQQATP